MASLAIHGDQLCHAGFLIVPGQAPKGSWVPYESPGYPRGPKGPKGGFETDVGRQMFSTGPSSCGSAGLSYGAHVDLLHPYRAHSGVEG